MFKFLFLLLATCSNLQLMSYEENSYEDTDNFFIPEEDSEKSDIDLFVSAVSRNEIETAKYYLGLEIDINECVECDCSPPHRSYLLCF